MAIGLSKRTTDLDGSTVIARTGVAVQSGTQAEHDVYTGELGEITYNTTDGRLHCHDGVTAGGLPISREDEIVGKMDNPSSVRLHLTADETIVTATNTEIPWDEASFDDGVGGIPLWLGLDKTFTVVNQTTEAAAIAAHGKTTGQGPYTLTTSGALPTGLAVDTDYWLIVVDSGNVAFATSYDNAIAGTKIDLTGAGSGTQTLVGSNKIGVPDGVTRAKIYANIFWVGTVTDLRTITLLITDASGTLVENILTSNLNDNSAGGLYMSVSSGPITVAKGYMIQLRVQHLKGSNADIDALGAASNNLSSFSAEFFV